MTTKTTATNSIIPRANDDDEDEDMLPIVTVFRPVIDRIEL